MFAKLFGSMYDGTLCVNWKGLITFQQMLILCDSQGVLDMTAEAISRRTNIPLDIIQEGIDFLSNPDPHSRTPGEDGRRIVTLDAHRPWGWRLVNYQKYRELRSAEEKREADRQRIATKRASKNSELENSRVNVAKSRTQSQRVLKVAHAEAEEEAVIASAREKKKSATPKKTATRIHDDFDVFKHMAEWALDKGLTDQQIDFETEKFISHHRSKGSLFLDWEDAWRTWILKAIGFGLPVKPPQPKPANGQHADLTVEVPERWWESPAGITAMGQRVGMPPKPGESSIEHCGRLLDAGNGPDPPA